MIINEDEYLEHFGVKGMKWGVRNERVRSAKSEYKKARKAYNKSFNKAHNYSGNHPISQFVTKKGKAKSDALWNQAISDANQLDLAKSAYKSAKQERKNAINKTYRSINKNSSFGEKLIYNDATRKKAAKFVVDNNMSVAEATRKAKGIAWRNTAAFIAASSAVSIGSYIIKNYQ